MANSAKGITVLDWLHSLKHNRQAYEFAYAAIHYLIPY
jgi:hypothetical protein